MKHSSIIQAIAQAIVWLAAASLLHAQPTPAPDCNTGRIQPPKIDPRHPYMHCFEPWGIMRGVLSTCIRVDGGENFGKEVVALGDVNHDDIADFAVAHQRCDTLADSLSLFPEEVFIYHGVKGGLPDVRSGQRLGPREVFSETRILCTGDWDADGHRDLLTAIHIYGDTSYGNTQRLGVQYVAVFWGNQQGEYSVDDTTRLSCGAPLWAGAYRAISTDLGHDSISDLSIWCAEGAGFVNGEVVPSAKLHFYRGHKGQRWGRDGVASTADARWWTPPPVNFLQVTDQDCDGHPDIALINQTGSTAYTYVSVLYGRDDVLPDTLSTETIYLEPSNGHYSLLTDVTGDRVPDLVTNCGSQEVLKIYAGKPGQRLKAMYGTGNEPAPPFPGRPWLTVALPAKVDPDDWFDTGFSPLYDLGDGNLDGIADVWTYTYGFFICYTTGQLFDLYIDAGMRWGYVTSATRLGDIDGSGVATFAVGFSGTPGGLAFYKATDSIPPTGDGVDLPHPQGFQCAQAAGVPMHDTFPTIALDVRPNPARGEILVRWSPSPGIHGDPVLTLVDASGREVLRRAVSDESNEMTLTTTRTLPRGVYLLILRIGDHSSATRVALQ